MSPPGIYVPGATTALTRRTTMRKAFLAPWHPMVENLRLWFLAVAQAKTDVAIHAVHDVVTHHHTRVTPSEDNLPEFLRIVHGETSKALNVLLAHERYDAPGEVFDDRQTHRMRLLDAEAQAGQHVYEHLNTVAAGLVSRPAHMPVLRCRTSGGEGGPSSSRGQTCTSTRAGTRPSCRSISRRTRSCTGSSKGISTR